jgi:hypothetical protein
VDVLTHRSREARSDDGTEMNLLEGEAPAEPLSRKTSADPADSEIPVCEICVICG